MTACWCFQAGHVYLHGIFVKHTTTPEIAFSRSIIVNAFVQCLLDVFCVIGFVKQADSVEKRGGTCEGCDGIGHDGEDVACSLSVVAADADFVNVGAGLGTTIASFYMLVGICWEKVCETQPSGHGLRNHAVILYQMLENPDFSCEGHSEA